MTENEALIPEINMGARILKTKILALKKQKNAIILGHYYQNPDIQDVADFVGDSLGLSQQAAKTNADIIVFAGVRFMAETAKILNPNKKVLLPDLNAGCSLSESCPPKKFKAFREAHPDHIAITYINCDVEVKANSDVICTSSNALKIIKSIPPNRSILFAPDKHLGKYLEKQTGRKMLLWDGACVVHEAFSIEKINRLKSEFPGSKLIAHPESQAQLLEIADYVGSTSAMIDFVVKDSSKVYIVATEAGILYQMSKKVKGKTLIPAPAVENNSCACSECHFMKMNTLEKLYLCLANETPEIQIPEEIRLKALKPIQRMLEFQ